MPGCSAIFCKNRSDQGFLMHVFPRDPKRRAIWAAQVKRDRPNWEPTNCCYLCEAHFEDSQFELRRLDGKVKLKPCAVPTIFHHTAVKPAKKPRFANNDARATERDTPGEEERTLLVNDVCSARNCTSFNRGEPVALFPFPDDEDRCREWVERSQNVSLTDVPVHLLRADARLCAEHFDDGQFADATRETLSEDALPSVFPRHFVSVPMVAQSEGAQSEAREGFESVKPEPSADAFTYRQLCARAPGVTLPSPAWALHTGDDHVAFVRTDLRGASIQVDALVFRDTCRAQVYLRGRRVLLGMGHVGTVGEVETLLGRLEGLGTEHTPTP